MDFKYQFVGTTKRYAKYEPTAECMTMITGSFYLALNEYEAKGKPEVIVLTLNDKA